MLEFFLVLAIILLGIDVAYRITIYRKLKHDTHAVRLSFLNYHGEVLAGYEFINGQIKGIQDQITATVDRPALSEPEQLSWK
jgi:hypothetical protein